MTASLRSVCALVAYDGTDFSGFQVQDNAPSVQGALEEALQRLTGHASRVVGSGRTDAGVHARGQVIAAEVCWAHDLEALTRAWNHYLPASILVRRVTEAPEGFHPRFSATSRTYRYTVLAPRSAGSWQPRRHPLWDRYGWVLERPLDVEAMNRAAALLVGEHDFATFGQPPQGENTVRRLEEAVWQRVQEDLPTLDPWPLERIVFTVTGNAFLRRMVRNLVGSLVAVGLGQWTLDDVADALAAQDRSRSAPPAPPNGLVLERVIYANHPHLFVE